MRRAQLAVFGHQDIPSILGRPLKPMEEALLLEGVMKITNDLYAAKAGDVTP